MEKVLEIDGDGADWGCPQAPCTVTASASCAVRELKLSVCQQGEGGGGYLGQDFSNSGIKAPCLMVALQVVDAVVLAATAAAVVQVALLVAVGVVAVSDALQPGQKDVI